MRALEIGANRGGISAWLAAQGHHVVCSDLEGTEQNARPLFERTNLLDGVRFEDIDATQIPYDNAFDLVAFKSVLGGVGHGGAIDRQRRAIFSMYRALRPGGVLLFAENLTGSPFHERLRRRFVRWGGDWRYVTIGEMREFLAPFSRTQMKTAGVLGALGRTEPQRRFLGRIDRAGLCALTPPAWRYIVFGVATK